MPADKLGRYMTSEAFLYDAIRTPRGKGKPAGGLHEVKPIQLITGLLHELRNRHPDLDPDVIDDVVLGVVTPIGDQGMDIARTAVLARPRDPIHITSPGQFASLVCQARFARIVLYTIRTASCDRTSIEYRPL